MSEKGFGVAGDNLAHVNHLILQRTGLRLLVKGTLNIRLPTPYIVKSDAIISAPEYNGAEFIKLQRCVIQGLRALIMRPNTHEQEPPWGHGPAHIELLSEYHLKSQLGLVASSDIELEVEGDDAWWSAAR